jgi:TldD protein
VTDSDLIVDGRLDVPIAPFVMEVRGVDMWRSIDRIGSDLAFDTCIGSCVRDGQPLAVSVGAPTIRLGVITVKC